MMFNLLTLVIVPPITPFYLTFEYNYIHDFKAKNPTLYIYPFCDDFL